MQIPGAIGIQYFITDYIMYVFLAWLPLYLMEAQQFSLQKMGIAAAFPWAAICIVTFAAAFISDKLVATVCQGDGVVDKATYILLG
ncbi:sugar phosphate permease [Sporomusaceae bacterium BoRhaA]|uniref:hypothetical protein n=1 Tax=Pelorhabdus rhamnosifermentans TaxID=2772457 RepID=UPI001FE7F8E0|nr:hypothetical protein [Pelorhabdus rhamnosifermentans]MBU2703715.1 sugar phosphate permease [Pelorhabdus rhamnosifermentans]